MANAENAKIQYESGQSYTAYVAMTDSGDHQHYTSAAAVWSGRSGYAPSVRPNGIVSGFNLITVAASGSNNVVDTAAFTAYSAGTLYTVAAGTDVAITRPSGAYAKVNSITMNSTGVVVVVAGTDGTDTVFSETRAATGGPPLIPVDSVEIGQVRISSATNAAITAAQIYQTIGTHTERYDYPVWNTSNIGSGSNATVAAAKNAHVKMASALPAIHTGPITKKVYIQYYAPAFSDISRSLDFRPIETTHTVASTQYYGGTIAGRSSAVGQGGFTAMLDDGVSDSLISLKNEILTFKFFPDRNKTPYVLTQGALGVSRTFPVADQVQMTATISGELSSAEFTS